MKVYIKGIFAILIYSQIIFTACSQQQNGQGNSGDNSQASESQPQETKVQVNVENIASNLNHPWGMAFLPDGRLLLTERAGNLRILDTDYNLSEPIKGVPEVYASGQGGMLDVALDPAFEDNNWVYLSYSEPGSNNTSSTALGRGKLENDRITDFEVIFRQEPKMDDNKHYGGRIVFESNDVLFLTLGERFKFDPAQDLSNHLGTVVRINKDGSIPDDNPFTDRQAAKDEIWSYGHRNIESAAIHPDTDELWVVEMGPKGGDELNLVQAGQNYGWPKVSWGDNYDGSKIPDPSTNSEYKDAVIHWTPVISPSGMVFYSGSMFSEWEGTALIGGLTAKGIVRVEINSNNAEEVERVDLGARIRDVQQAPDGSIYVLTDQSNGKVLKLTPEN